MIAAVSVVRLPVHELDRAKLPEIQRRDASDQIVGGLLLAGTVHGLPGAVAIRAGEFGLKAAPSATSPIPVVSPSCLWMAWMPAIWPIPDAQDSEVTDGNRCKAALSIYLMKGSFGATALVRDCGYPQQNHCLKWVRFRRNSTDVSPFPTNLPPRWPRYFDPSHRSTSDLPYSHCMGSPLPASTNHNMKRRRRSMAQKAKIADVPHRGPAPVLKRSQIALSLALTGFEC